MPFGVHWTPAPQDMSLPVHKEEPKGPSHHCKYCGGWIDGRSNSYRENTIAPLAGRRGTAEHCRRCGKEISFFGMYS